MTTNKIYLNHVTQPLSTADANYGLGCFDFTLELEDFEIIDENGYTFNFEEGPKARLRSGEDRCPHPDAIYTDAAPNCSMEFHDHWRMSSILDVNGQELFDFQYNGEFFTRTTPQVTQSLFNTTQGQWGSAENSVTTVESRFRIVRNLINRITYRSGEVEFTFAWGGSAGRYLSKVTFKDSEGNSIREVHLIYDHTTYDHSFLTRVEEYDLNSLPITAASEPSKFQEFKYVPKSDHSPDTRNIDHWGFRNNADQDVLVPNTTSLWNYTATSSRSDRTPRFNKTREGMIERIRYSSGQEEEFFYELNDFSKMAGDDSYVDIDEFPLGNINRVKPKAGGLRLQYRELRNKNGETIRERYDYTEVDNDQKSTGILIDRLEYKTVTVDIDDGAALWYRQYSSSMIRSRRHTLQGPVVYKTVRKSYEYKQGSSWVSAEPLLGSIITSYTFNHDVYDQAHEFPYLSVVYPDWENGLPENRQIWGEYDNSNGYLRKISETSYDYGYLLDNDGEVVFNSIPASKYGKYINQLPEDNINYWQEGFIGNSHEIESKYYYLQSEIRRDYFNYPPFLGSEPEVNQTVKTYLIEDPSTLKVSSINTVLHDGTEYVERFKYVNDYSSSSDIVQATAFNIRRLKRAGLLSWPIEHAKFIVEDGQEKLLESKINFYRKINSDQLVPLFSHYRITELTEPLLNYEMSSSNSTEDDEFVYQSQHFSGWMDRVSAQNEFYVPVESTNEHGTFNCELIDPATGRMTAKVINGTLNTSRYTSFEEGLYHGGWSPFQSGIINLNSSSVPSGCPSYAPTGNVVYHLENNEFNSTGGGTLPDVTYTLSFYSAGYFWPLENFENINVLNHNVEQVGEWEYHQYTFEWSGSGDQLITMGGSGFIDELRLCENDATMITSGFKLNGRLEFQADASSQPTNFYYDEKGRIKWVRGYANEVSEYHTYEEKDILSESSFNKHSIYSAKKYSLEQNDFIEFGPGSSEDISKSTIFTDGWGRHKQTQSLDVIKNHDMVSYSVYDPIGRKLEDHLPYMTYLSDSESYIVDPESEQQAYYSNRPDPNENTAYPFERTTFERNPLNRPASQSSIGEGFEIGSGHELIFSYDYSNQFSPVLKWVYNHADGTASSGNGNTAGTYYGSGELLQTEMTDQRGTRNVVYYNARGQKVAEGTYVRVFQNPDGQDVTGSIDQSGLSTRLALTYYVYDAWNRLRFTIPHVAIVEMSNMSSPEYFVGESGMAHQNNHHRMIASYSYDKKGRLYQEKLPGEQRLRSYYFDSKDRVILSSEPSQDDGKFFFKKYDSQNRVALAGEVSLTETDIQGTIDSYGGDIDVYRTQSGATSIFGYSNNTFPGISENDVLQVYYFDDHDFHNNTDFSFSPVEEIDYTTPCNKSLSTGTLTRVLSFNENLGDMLLKVNYYGSRKRLIQSCNENHIGGFDRISNFYNDKGQLEISHQSHKYQASSDPINIRTKYFYYDNSGKLRSVRQNINDDQPVYISNRDYDENGKLKELNLHKRQAINYLQSIDYRYNHKSQLTHINNSSLIIDQFNQEDDDVFGQEIMYHELSPEVQVDLAVPVCQGWPGFTPDYSGNVSGVIWGAKAPEVDGATINRHLYTFEYDGQGQLIRAEYGADKPSNPGRFNFNHGRYSTRYNYDLAGNITRLQRRHRNYCEDMPVEIGGGTGGGLQSVDDLLDDLQFSYQDGSFMLDRVDEGNDGDPSYLESHSHFTEYVSENSEYTYDIAGRNVEDKNKRISIDYNVIGNISQVDHDAFIRVNYLYDAFGNKLRKSSGYLPQGDDYVEVDYIGNFVYENGDLKMIYHPEGVIRPRQDDPNNPNEFVYDYFVKDYLGSVRVVISEEDETEEVVKFLATMEEVHAFIEERDFDNLPGTREDLPTNYPVDGSVALNEKIAMLIADGDMVIGPSLVRNVRVGEKVTVSVDYFYEEDAPGATYDNVGFLIDEILVALASSAAGVVPVGEGTLNSIATGQTQLGNQLYQLINDNIDTNSVSRPHAYLVYTAFDNQKQLVPSNSGFIQVTDPNQLRTILTNEITIQKDGFMHIYLSNGSSNKGVSFDKFMMTSVTGKTRQINHYYPYGLPIADIDGNYNDYLNKYSAKEHQTGEYESRNLDQKGLEMFDFEARFWEPQLARWTSPDPLMQFQNPYLGMGNNPVRYVDSDGQIVFTFSAIIIGSMIGSFTGAVMAGVSGKSAGQIMGAFGIGALAGAASGAVGGGVNSALGGGKFVAGALSAKEAITTTGAIAGAITGAASGATNGLIQGTGNALLEGSNIGDALDEGFTSSWKQALTGFAAGGIIGGIDAAAKGRNILTGSSKKYKMSKALLASGDNVIADEYVIPDDATLSNSDHSKVFYRNENGVAGMNNQLRHGEYITDPIDGVATSKFKNLIFKVPDGGTVKVTLGGEVNLNMDIAARTKLGAYKLLKPDYQYGWLDRNYFRSINALDDNWNFLFRAASTWIH